MACSLDSGTANRSCLSVRAELIFQHCHTFFDGLNLDLAKRECFNLNLPSDGSRYYSAKLKCCHTYFGHPPPIRCLGNGCLCYRCQAGLAPQISIGSYQTNSFQRLRPTCLSHLHLLDFPHFGYNSQTFFCFEVIIGEFLSTANRYFRCYSSDLWRMC